jgi:predicted enzyme related to lactoylglutathione lyase
MGADENIKTIQGVYEVDDLDAATAEVEQLGGRWLQPGTTRQLEGFRWRCMADPEGNEFDLDLLPADL